MIPLLRISSLIVIFSSGSWIVIHLLFVGYVTWQLGHFPRPMIDDPNLILMDDSFYDSMTTWIDRQGAGEMYP